jgi:hypothetical protein
MMNAYGEEDRGICLNKLEWEERFRVMEPYQEVLYFCAKKHLAEQVESR